MFVPYREIPSLELCKKLKKIGYPQGKGYYYYRYSYDKDFYIGLYEEIAWEENPEVYYAPLQGELEEWLHRHTYPQAEILLGKQTWDGKYFCNLETIGRAQKIIIQSFLDGRGPNVRVKMLIWLKENGYVNFEEEGEDEQTQ